MAKNNMFIEILQTTLEEYKNKENTEKFTMDSLIKSIRLVSNTLKEEKKEKKEKKEVKLSAYNYYVKDNMSKVIKKNPKMTGAERMREIARMWTIYKENNSNYKNYPNDQEKDTASDQEKDMVSDQEKDTASDEED